MNLGSDDGAPRSEADETDQFGVGEVVEVIDGEAVGVAVRVADSVAVLVAVGVAVGTVVGVFAARLVALLTASLLACTAHRIPGVVKTSTRPHISVGPRFFEHAPQHERIAVQGDPAALTPLVKAYKAPHETSKVCLLDAMEALGAAALPAPPRTCWFTSR